MITIPDYRIEPFPVEKEYPECPVCGKSLYDFVVEDKYGYIVGCSECTRTLTADEYLVELNEEA